MTTLETDVSVLYVDPRGPYPSLVADCWDEARDARNYAGPNPVVAHPPCGPWSSLRHLWRGQQRDCALIAVDHVRRFGGVLEHPAGSKLWSYAEGVGRPLPCEVIGWDKYGGRSFEVDQCDWGHPARKRTWLYVVGLGPYERLPPTPPHRKPTHWCSGVHTPGARGETPPGIKVCSAQQRRRTPRAFAEWLIALAKMARVREAKSA